MLGAWNELAQPCEAGEHATLDRPQGHAEPLRQLGLREAAVVRELERLALVLRQLAERGLDVRSLLAEVRLLGNARSRRLRRLFEALAASQVLAADEVDGAAMDEREDPGRRLGALAAVAVRRAPDREERILHGVLRERLVAEDAVGETVGNAAVAVVELGQPLVVPAGDRGEDLLVTPLGWAALLERRRPCEVNRDLRHSRSSARRWSAGRRRPTARA